MFYSALSQHFQIWWTTANDLSILALWDLYSVESEMQGSVPWCRKRQEWWTCTVQAMSCEGLHPPLAWGRISAVIHVDWRGSLVFSFGRWNAFLGTCLTSSDRPVQSSHPAATQKVVYEGAGGGGWCSMGGGVEGLCRESAGEVVRKTMTSREGLTAAPFSVFFKMQSVIVSNALQVMGPKYL